MQRDQFNRPVCFGQGPTRPCRTPVHPGYTICYSCYRPYTCEQIQAALEHPQNAAFKAMISPTSPATLENEMNQTAGGIELPNEMEMANEEIEQLKQRIAVLEEVLSTAINTVECASSDIRKGEELPWYRMARKALPDFNRHG